MNESLQREQLELAELRLDGAMNAVPRKRLHSKYDPRKEAKAQMPDTLDPTRTLLVFGAGLGFVVELMLDAGASVIWIEPDAEILREALGTLDFREALRAKRLRITTQISGAKIDEWRLTNHTTSFWSHRAFLTPALSQLKQHAEFLLNRHSVNQATLARFEKVWAVNLCENLLSLSGAGKVSELFGIHPGKPAVVIGAGPSLTDSLGGLKAVRSKAIFVAVDTAVRVLQHAGIDPDFIVTVDPQPVNRVFLEGYRGGAAIVLDPTVSLHSARYASRCNTYVSGTPFRLGRLFERMLGGALGELAFGGSVSTNAYDLARKLGCDPVFLVGQDLAFSDNQVHARGAALEERLSWREARTYRREMHNFQQLTAIPPLTVEDLRGGLSQTNGKLAIFYRWFEARFQSDLAMGLQIRNCTSRGARFTQIPHGELAELLGWPEMSFARQPQAREAPNLPGLLAEVKRLSLALEDINAAYRGIWSLEESRRVPALDELGGRLRKTQELELLGNTAQSAIQRLREDVGNEAIQELHQGLHGAAALLARCLKRVARVLQEVTAPGS